MKLDFRYCREYEGKSIRKTEDVQLPFICRSFSIQSASLDPQSKSLIERIDHVLTIYTEAEENGESLVIAIPRRAWNNCDVVDQM